MKEIKMDLGVIDLAHLEISDKHLHTMDEIRHLVVQREFDKAVNLSLELLKFNPCQIDFLCLLVYVYIKSGALYHAITMCKRALAVDASHNYANYLMGLACFKTFEFEGASNVQYLDLAEHFLNNALVNNGDFLPALEVLGGVALSKRDEIKIKNLYAKISSLDPNNKIAHFIVSSAAGNIPPYMPKEYVENLFDQYARNYESHLNIVLESKVPQMVADTLLGHDNITTILDLGCGTGLCAEYLMSSGYAFDITGVDISSQMLDIAKGKAVYRDLYQEEILCFLKEYKYKFDAIISSDVFVYFGDLEEIFASVFNLLNNNGVFVFSVSMLKDESKDYFIDKTMNYSHARSYLIRLAQKYKFQIRKFLTVNLRREQSGMQSGYIVSLIKGD